jgi:hypothetical protein
MDDGFDLAESKSALFGFSGGKIFVKAEDHSFFGVGFHVFGDMLDTLAFAGCDVNDEFVFFEVGLLGKSGVFEELWGFLVVLQEDQAADFGKD